MSLDPVIVNINTPKPPFKLPHLPSFTPKITKILTAASAVVISLSMISFTVFSVLANKSSFKKAHNIGTSQNPDIPEQTTETTKSDAALPGGGIAVGTGGTTGTNSPVVTLTAEPASVIAGRTSVLKWSVTKDPSSCVASEDWSGTKSPTGTETTPALTTSQLYTLTCKNATGTGFSTVKVGVITQGVVGDSSLPDIRLVANQQIYTGVPTTLTWTVINGATSCVASGDWSGIKPVSGTADVATFTVARKYSFTLTCKNSAGKQNSGSTSLTLVDPPAGFPIVSVSSNPVGPVTPGTAVTLSWNTTNNPTSCEASGDWSGAKNASGAANSGPLNTIRPYLFTLTCKNATGDSFDTATVAVLPNAPGVSLTVSPPSIYVGNSSTLSWSATNSPTSPCTASGDWSGSKTASTTTNNQSTGTLNTVKTYLYGLSCTNAGGTTSVSNVPLAVTLPPKPVVTISASPISITSGNSSTLSWSVTNNPTSCTASGDWTGTKSASGPQSIGPLTTIQTYTYTLTCSNAGGSNSATTTVSVTSGVSSGLAPVVTITASPNPIGTGSSTTLSWVVDNNPTSCTASGSWSGSQSASGSMNTVVINTAGSYTYTLTCSNSTGSGTGSATLVVIAVPVVSISVSPSSITTGSSASITWSATNNPSSCTAGGSWTGSKGTSGTNVSLGAFPTAGSYTFSLSCTNTGGTGSNSAPLTVSNPGPVYCSGRTICYGPNDLASRASPGYCWGWNIDWVIDISTFRPQHPGGIKTGSTSTIENASATCNHDIHSILAGTASIPGYFDCTGNPCSGKSTHVHKIETQTNSTINPKSILSSYRVGYYDATKP